MEVFDKSLFGADNEKSKWNILIKVSKMENQSQRNASIDLLRMISMYFVVILHVQGQGGIFGNTELFSSRDAVVVFYHLAAY